jgi:hypothetical protein
MSLPAHWALLDLIYRGLPPQGRATLEFGKAHSEFSSYFIFDASLRKARPLSCFIYKRAFKTATCKNSTQDKN